MLVSARECKLSGIISQTNSGVSKHSPNAQIVSRLIGGHLVTVDADDAHLLDAYAWQLTQGNHVVAHNRGGAYTRQKNVLLHRLIANPPAGMEVDHRDRNPLNNTRANLRVCTRQQNQVNTAKRPGCLSRYKGVYLVRSTGRWAAKVTDSGKLRHLGTYDTDTEAARVVDDEMSRLYGEFPYLNFPEAPRTPPSAASE